MNYPFNIPSIGQLQPGFAQNPHIVNVQAFQGVNASVVAGTPVDPLAVVNAENTVESIREQKVRTCSVTSPGLTTSLVGFPGVITNEVIETAKNRAHKLRETRQKYCEFLLGFNPNLLPYRCIIAIRVTTRRRGVRPTTVP